MKLLLLISGHDTTKFCKVLFNAVGRHKLFSLNDNVSGEQMQFLSDNWRKVPQPVVVITGDEDLMDLWFNKLYPDSPEPVFRLRLSEW
tara:strand:+ start:537 stop:800 length:264 start_codon:yes stop_codon:yes gene_type:complete